MTKYRSVLKSAYLYEDSPAFAHSFYYTTRDKARSLGEFSKRGRIVPELRDPTIREVFIYGYRLIYKILEDKIVILTFIHGARELNHLEIDPQ